MNDYKNALEFWDKGFAEIKGEKIDEKFIKEETLNEIFKKYINKDSKVLDFGCGSGWGLMEMALTVPFSLGIGIDQSPNVIRYTNECVNLSQFKNLKFICGDHKTLDNYKETFDFVFTTNVIDVVPDEIFNEIIENLYNTLKTGGYILISLNPFFTENELTEVLKMEKRGNYYYKNNILRCNYKTVSEWEKIFSAKFNLIRSEGYKLQSTDKYERRMYLLRKD